MLVLNKQVKPTIDTFLNVETTIKSIQLFSKKKFTQTLNFLNHWVLSYKPEMINILNIRGEPIFDDALSRLRFTRTIRTPT